MRDEIITEINGTTFKVRTMDGGYKKFRIDDIFAVDEDNISKEFMQQASLYGFFATIMATAEDIANRASFDVDQEYALCDSDARNSLDRNGMKYTEAVIKGMVYQYESYQKTVAINNKCQYDFKLLKALVKALEQRAEMLVSLGSHLRHESNMTGMNIKERQMDTTVKNVKAVLDGRKSVRTAAEQTSLVNCKNFNN